MDIPKTAIEFNDRFNSEERCLAYLQELRWEHGFVCPNCGHDDGYQLSSSSNSVPTLPPSNFDNVRYTLSQDTHPAAHLVLHHLRNVFR